MSTRTLAKIGAPLGLQGYDLLALSVVLAAILVTLRDAIRAPHMMLTGHDISQQYNWEINTRHALSQGQLPLWNPYVFGGFPAFADFQTALLYPPYFLLRLLPMESFLLWNTALHLMLAGAGTYLLCRHCGTSRVAACLAALGFALSGALTPRIFAGMPHFICGLSWLPWALYFTFRTAERGSLIPHPGLVVVLALQYLAGYIQFFVYTVAVVAFGLLWLTVSQQHSVWTTLRRGGRAVVLVGATLAFTIGLVSVQLTSTLELLPEMGRAGGISYEAAARWAPDPRDLLTLLFPRAFALPTRDFHDESGAILWEKAAYAGLLPGLLAMVGAISGWRRREVGLMITLAVLAACFALANHLPLYRLHFALFSGFRYPGRLLPICSLAIAILGAVGFDTMRRWAEASVRASARPAAAAGLLVLSIVGLSCIPLQAGGSALPETILGTPWWVVPTTAALIVLLLISRGRPRMVRGAALLAVLVLAADLVSFGQVFVTTQDPPRLQGVANVLAADNVDRVVSACEEGFSLYRPLDVTVPMVDGLNTAFLKHYAWYASIVRNGRVTWLPRQFPTIWSDTPVRLDLLDMMSVTHVVKCSPLRENRFQLVRQVEGLYVYRNRNPRARARWVCDVDLVDSDERAVELLSDRQRDARQRVVLPQSAASSVPQGCVPDAKVENPVRDTPRGEMLVTVETSTSGVLLMSEPYYPERRAFVNGVEAPLLRANLAFSAVVLPPGHHRVELDLNPRPIFVGLGMTLLTLVLMAGLELRRARAGAPRG